MILYIFLDRVVKKINNLVVSYRGIFLVRMLRVKFVILFIWNIFGKYEVNYLVKSVDLKIEFGVLELFY